MWNAARSGSGLFSACIYLRAKLAENMGVKLHHMIFAKVSFNNEKTQKVRLAESGFGGLGQRCMKVLVVTNATANL